MWHLFYTATTTSKYCALFQQAFWARGRNIRGGWRSQASPIEAEANLIIWGRGQGP